jgi:uroporphyrinogen decarboxylase
MNSRERVITALNHEEPDRVPIDLGGSVVTSISLLTYEAVRNRLGLPKIPICVLEKVQQIAQIDDDIIDMFGVDVLPVFANPPSCQPVFINETSGAVSFQDDFGATLRRPKGCFYYEWQDFPLTEPSIIAMEKMAWPDPADPARYHGLGDRVKKLRLSTDKALLGMAPCGHDLFNQLFRVRGMENGLMDLILELEFVEAFFKRLSETICTAQRLFLAEVGDLIDVHFAADDLAGQFGPLIHPELYRRVVKPHQARIMETIKQGTRAKIFYHSCGAVSEFIDDLIDMGVDILNPVQVTASGMDTAVLKKRYGKRLTFWGGGCDTQWTLWQGSTRQVRDEVKRRIRDLAPGGGFVFNPVHNIQPFVPAENVMAMYAAAQEFGQYPIRLS